MISLLSVRARHLLSGHTLVLIAMVGLAWYGCSSGALDPEFLSREAAGGKHWSTLLLISFGLMLLCAATPLPAEAVAFANGICFGPLAGAAITRVSATTGAAITFALCRRLLRNKGAIPHSGAHHARLHHWFENWGQSGLFLARLIPVVPFFTLNFAAALLPVTTRDYILITAIAILPHALLFSAMGSYIQA